MCCLMSLTVTLLYVQMLEDSHALGGVGHASHLSGEDSDIMNRLSVKRQSQRVTTDANRKEKDEARQKKLAEKMVRPSQSDRSTCWSPFDSNSFFLCVVVS